MLYLQCSKRSQYRHPPLFLSDLLATLDVIGRQSAARLNLIVNDINFHCTDWQQMALSHNDEAVFLEGLFDHNFQQMIKGQKNAFGCSPYEQYWPSIECVFRQQDQTDAQFGPRPLPVEDKCF